MERRRVQRISHSITRVIADALLRSEVSDPRVHPLITIYRTNLSNDLRRATVYITGDISKRSMRRSLIGLNSAAGYLQVYISKQLRIRNTPRLRFVHDKSIQEGFEVVNALENNPTRTDTPS